MGRGWDDLDLDAVPGRPGRFTGVISDSWQLVVNPLGGFAAAMAARAMARTLDVPEQTLRTFSTVFAGQVGCGPVEIDVEVLRQGRSMSQLSAHLRNPGSVAGLQAVAVFGSTRRGFDFTEPSFPDVPGPDGLRSYRDPIPEGVDFEFDREPMPFWEQVVDSRPALGGPPWEPQPPGPAEAAHWYRLDEPPVRADGTLDPLTAFVLCDTMPGAVFQRLGNDTELWFGPSADFTIHLLNPARPGWLLAHNRARHAGEGYASVEMDLWDPTGPTLVAHATQIMFFAFGV